MTFRSTANAAGGGAPRAPQRLAWFAVLLGGLSLAMQVFALVGRQDATAAAPDPARGDHTAAGQLQELVARAAALEERLASVAPQADVRSAVLDTAAIEAIVDRALARRAAAAAAAPAEQRSAAVRRALAALSAAPADADVSSVWEQARAAGVVDALVAEFEQRARTIPTADASVDLGLAYVQALLGAGDPAERTRLGALADAAFSTALERDPDHWRARFRKAEGLAHWPAAAGKQSEAIAHFEQLVEQQTHLPTTPQQAQTYLYLGSLYEQTGQPSKAAAAWAQGAARHPSNAELQRKAQHVARQ